MRVKLLGASVQRKRRKGRYGVLKTGTYTFPKNSYARGVNPLLIEDPKNELRKNLKSVKGTLAMEDLHLTLKEEELITLNSLGVISDEEFDRKLMELIKNE